MPDVNQTIQLLKRIRQVREFTDQPVPTSALNDVLEVARWTGSARNVQPWHFVVIERPDDLAAFAAMGRSATFFRNAPLVIAVVIDQASPQPRFDEARVIERIFIAAAAHGLVAGIGTFAPDDIPLASQRLHLPDGLTFHAGVALGYPDRSNSISGANKGGRKPIEDLVHYGQFGHHTR